MGRLNTGRPPPPPLFFLLLLLMLLLQLLMLLLLLRTLVLVAVVCAKIRSLPLTLRVVPPPLPQVIPNVVLDEFFGNRLAVQVWGSVTGSDIRQGGISAEEHWRVRWPGCGVGRRRRRRRLLRVRWVDGLDRGPRDWRRGRGQGGAGTRPVILSGNAELEVLVALLGAILSTVVHVPLVLVQLQQLCRGLPLQ